MSIKLVAHRGGALDLDEAATAENQLDAFKKAMGCGCKTLETDLHLTKDGRVILLHDSTLRKRVLSYRSLADLTKEEIAKLDQPVCKLTYEEVQALTHKHVNYLEELLGVREDDVELMLEIKGNNPEIVAIVAEKIKNIDPSKIIFICFFSEIIEEIHHLKLPNRVFLLTCNANALSGEIQLSNIDDLISINLFLKKFRIDGIGIEYRNNDADIVAITRELRGKKPNFSIHLWVHRDFENSTLFKLAEQLNAYCNSDRPCKQLNHH